MYRKRNGSIGFSFTKFAHAAVPNFFADESTARLADLHPQRRDLCYMHQIASESPFAFDERTFFVAGVTDNENMSKKVFKALKKHEMLRDDGTIDTYKIGPRFAHQLACINMVRQRELVNLLFWWEEECQRLKKLIDEEEELNKMIDESEKHVTENENDVVKKEMLDQLKFARERVRMKKRQRPSQRRPDVENDSDDLMSAFHGRSKSDPALPSAPASTAPQQQRDIPPEYYGPA
jgi:hypothetical protein